MAAPRGTLYRIELIEEVRRQLRCLPEPKIAEVSKLEVVRALAPDIEELQKAGHTIETIATTLSGLGVTLTKATLRTYLGKSRPAGHRGRGRRRQAAGGRPAKSPENGDRHAAAPRAVAIAPDSLATSIDGDGTQSTVKNARNHNTDDRKEKLSVAPQETPARGPTPTRAHGGVQGASGVAVTAGAHALSHPQGVDAQQRPTDPSSARDNRSEAVQAKSEKATVRGAGTTPATERPSWTFVPRQDSNDL